MYVARGAKMTPLHNADCYSRNRCDASPLPAGQYVFAHVLVVAPERPSMPAEVWLSAGIIAFSCSKTRLSPDLRFATLTTHQRRRKPANLL